MNKYLERLAECVKLRSYLHAIAMNGFAKRENFNH